MNIAPIMLVMMLKTTAGIQVEYLPFDTLELCERAAEQRTLAAEKMTAPAVWESRNRPMSAHCETRTKKRKLVEDEQDV